MRRTSAFRKRGQLVEQPFAIFGGCAEGVSGLQWAPDSRRLLYLYRGESGSGDSLWIMEKAGARRAPLLVEGCGIWSARWSPDSESIFFCSDRSGSAEVWKLDRSTRAIEPLTNLGRECASCCCSPDGSTVAFLARLDGGYHICTVSSEGGEVRVLESIPLWKGALGRIAPREQLHCLWGPKEALIMYTGYKCNEKRSLWAAEVWMVDSQGKHPRCIYDKITSLEQAGGFEQLAWSPDGRKVAACLRIGERKDLVVFRDASTKLLQREGIDELSLQPWDPSSRQLLFAATSRPASRSPMHLGCVDLSNSVERVFVGESFESIYREASFSPDEGALWTMHDGALHTISPEYVPWDEISLTTGEVLPPAGVAREEEASQRARGKLERLRHKVELASRPRSPRRWETFHQALGLEVLHEDVTVLAPSLPRTRLQHEALRLLFDDDPILRLGALRCLSVLPPRPRGFPAAIRERLEAILLDRLGETPQKRGLAARLLAPGCKKRGYDSLVECLADEEEAVKVAAIEALGRIGDPRVLEEFRSVRSTLRRGWIELPFEASSDSGREAIWEMACGRQAHGDRVALAVVGALARLGGAQAQLQLAQLSRHVDPGVRYWASLALAQKLSPTHIGVWQRHLRDEHPAIRSLAIDVMLRLNRLPEEALPRLTVRARLVPPDGTAPRRDGVHLEGELRNEGPGDATLVAVHAAVGGKVQWQQWERLPAGGSVPFGLSFSSLSLEGDPDGASIVAESSEGARTRLLLR